MILVRPPGGTARSRQLSDRALEAAGTDRDRDRYRDEGRAGSQRQAPVVLGIGGPEQGQVRAAGGLPDLPVPPAIVLDLPRPRPAVATVN